ncbi:MAG: 1-deoxy-D-xylulose-5-phosphate synthase [SAR324 cluster bacterium]|nr:1-deoxy-D-xylulose-5-phosphate synthase [SAR324 cluster bacterium]
MQFNESAKLDDFLNYFDSDLSKIANLNDQQLAQLAKLIRKRILAVVSKVGGHLASSLGAVELTLVLYHIYNLEQDKVIWDVGHQTYTHKILTGRNSSFEKIGVSPGIAKFLSRSESKYDFFGAGHASTSISAALGILIASEAASSKSKVIAVIGDGAMTGGLAYEAVNLAGHLKKNLVVVLNDNDMSIDVNIGLLIRTRTFIQTTVSYNYIRNLIKRISQNNRLVNSLANFLKRVDKSFMEFLAPKAWFEALGFHYFGLIDGHDIKAMTNIFNRIKNIEGPILVHVRTIKGRGYSFAEKNSLRYHGVSPFEPESGNIIAKPATGRSLTEIWSDSISKLFNADKKVVIISAAMIQSLGLKELFVKHPKRVFDVGIAEANAVCLAAGMAANGLKPFVAIYSTFLQRAYDQIIHDVALQNLPVKFMLDRAGFVGADGATHHGMFDISYLRIIPNLVIMSPRDGKELTKMIYTAYHYNDGPIAIRYKRTDSINYYKKNELPGIDDLKNSIKIGQSEQIRNGKDGTILSIGSLALDALEVADMLAKDGIEISVIDAKFIKPLDAKMLKKVAKAGKWLVTLEENVKSGGFGSAVLEFMNENNLKQPIITLGIPDKFINQGTVEQQKSTSFLTPIKIRDIIKKNFF